MKCYPFIASCFLTIALLACSKGKKCQEQKIPDCIVTFELNPVCGCNGKTYSNPSEASCMGITEFTNGACR